MNKGARFAKTLLRWAAPLGAVLVLVVPVFVAHAGEGGTTHYKSGNLLHFDGSVQQILPMESGFLTLGAEGFYLKQATCDGGDGATLGCFKGKTAGFGPMLGYIYPLSRTEQRYSS